MEFDRRSMLKRAGAAMGASLLALPGTAQNDDYKKLNEFQETFTLGPAVGYVYDVEVTKYDPVEGAEEITATLTWDTAPAQDLDLFFYGGAQRIATSQQTNPPAEAESFTQGVREEEPYYYLESRGFVAARAACTLTVVERGRPPEAA